MPVVRDIIHIDEEKCTGCGLCIPACAEGALEIVDGKARLKGEVYCDGLGACLGDCPEGALTVIRKEAEEFDEELVEEMLKEQGPADVSITPAEPMGIADCAGSGDTLACGCPSSSAMALTPKPVSGPAGEAQSSQLSHWPVKLQLLNPGAEFLAGSDLILLADCSAAAFAGLHTELLPGKAVAMACPKLDDANAHIAKLADVLKGARPRSLTIVRMEVPCCGGLEIIAQKALEKAGLSLTPGVMVISRDGKVLADQAAA